MHARLGSIVLGCTLAALAARADDHGAAVPLLPAYRTECAACHLAYPPGMLPAASWDRLMRGLPQHFGADASLDAETVREVSQWLAAHAGTYRRVREPPPQDRITHSAWFLRKHDDVPPGTWKLPVVKSPANCAACHTTADQGIFDERHVRLPR